MLQKLTDAHVSQQMLEQQNILEHQLFDQIANLDVLLPNTAQSKR